RTKQVVEHPFASQDGRRACCVRRNAEDRRLRYDAAALLAVQFDPLELLTVNAFNTVVARQRAIDVSETAIDEIQHAPIFTENGVHEKASLLAHRRQKLV